MNHYIKTTDYLSFLLDYSEKWRTIQRHYVQKELLTKLSEAPEQEVEKLGKDTKLIELKLDLIVQEYNRAMYYSSYNFDSVEIPEHSQADFFLWFSNKLKETTTLH